MLTKEQLHELSKLYKINESVVAREFLQILFLKELYNQNFSKEIFFKGGTCIRLIYGGTRFSEDLDFTVMMEEEKFMKFMKKFFKEMENRYPIRFKERKSIAGKTFLITTKMEPMRNDIFVKLDFSFREDVIENHKEVIIENEYPVVFTSFVYCLSKDEMLAEKVRAFLNRDKYRDIYDMWVLLERGAKFQKEMINTKLKYYNQEYSPQDILEKVSSRSKKTFIEELRPFVPISEREKLGDFFEYVCEYIKKELD